MDLSWLTNFDIWVCIGLLGQALFTARFVVQWIASEKQRKSVVPVHFWYLSIIGSIILWIYAVHKRDLVFTLGQSFGIIVYLRNLYFIHSKENNIKSGSCE